MSNRDPKAAIERLRAELAKRGGTIRLTPGATLTDRTFKSRQDAPAQKAAPSTAAAPRSSAPPSRLPVIPIDGAEAESDLAIVGVLGEGGMGRVLLARQRSLGRDVAVKVLKPGSDDEDAREALHREGAFMGLLEHPSVIPVHALGQATDGAPLLVMKRVEGVSWRDLVKDPRHAAWERVDGGASTGSEDRLVAHLQILMQVCNALALSHERGVVHRDIKPGNVMLGGFGEVYLTDFGIALQVGAAKGDAMLDPVLVGTPSYLAPEMAECDIASIDARTDVYLLGSTLHEILTGTSRHPGDDLLDVLMTAQQSDPVAYGPDVPAELAAICNRATSRAREDRFPSALAFRQAVAEYLRHRGSLALTSEAVARLAQLREALATGRERTPGEDSRLHVLMTECRFGFMQALREWPENPGARQGLAACLDAMIDHAIATRNAAGARALLAELGRAGDARVDALERELRDKDARAERLGRIEHDLDVSASVRGRLILFGVVTVIAIGLAAQVAFRGADMSRFTHDEVIVQSAVVFAVCAIVTWIFRKRILSNAASRRIVAGAAMGPVMMLMSRAAAKATGESLTQVVIRDQYVFLALTVMAALNIHWHVAFVVPILLGALGLSVFWPQLAGVGFMISIVSISLAMGMTGLARGRRLE